VWWKSDDGVSESQPSAGDKSIKIGSDCEGHLASELEAPSRARRRRRAKRIKAASIQTSHGSLNDPNTTASRYTLQFRAVGEERGFCEGQAHRDYDWDTPHRADGRYELRFDPPPTPPPIRPGRARRHAPHQRPRVVDNTPPVIGGLEVPAKRNPSNDLKVVDRRAPWLRSINAVDPTRTGKLCSDESDLRQPRGDRFLHRQRPLPRPAPGHPPRQPISKGISVREPLRNRPGPPRANDGK